MGKKGALLLQFFISKVMDVAAKTTKMNNPKK
jgi:hypothetical protein